MPKTPESTQNYVCYPSGRVEHIVAAVGISFDLNSNESYFDTAACVSSRCFCDVNATPRSRCCCCVMTSLLFPSVIVV